MNENSQCEFYISFVKLLNEFFNQDGAQRIKIFWMGVPSETDMLSLQAMVSWRIELQNQKIKGSTGDELWSPIGFPEPFWDCCTNQELTKKIQNSIFEHCVFANEDTALLKRLWGVTFIKENWKEILVDTVGSSCLDAYDAGKLNEKLNKAMNCPYSDDAEECCNDFKL